MLRVCKLWPKMQKALSLAHGEEALVNSFPGASARKSCDVESVVHGVCPGTPESKRRAFSSFLFGSSVIFHAPIDASTASSTYSPTPGLAPSQSPFNAKQALQPGSGYWCSTGKHFPDTVVTWTGKNRKRRSATGMKISWAYAPGEERIRTTADGTHWDTVVPWHKPATDAVSFEEDLVFDRPRHVLGVKVEMRKPRPWGYFGINQATWVL